jgi:quercetin dioxygenase-like cupin family protein
MRAIMTIVGALPASASAIAQPAAERPLAIKANDPALKWGPCPPIFRGDCKIAVLHGDPAKPNANVFLRVGGGSELPPHTHTSAERMILVSGRLRVDYQGAPPATLAPGDYAYGPPGLPHSASCLGKQACTLFIAFEGPVDALPHAGGGD